MADERHDKLSDALKVAHRSYQVAQILEGAGDLRGSFAKAKASLMDFFVHAMVAGGLLLLVYVLG